MNLDNVTVELRPRSEWEAADFGVRMIRRDAAAIYRVWFAITLPLLALAMLLIFFTPFATLAPILYWWFEPVADGPILRIISRRLFGENADVRATLRATGRLAWRNKIFLLTPYRFHFARSIAMPVTQLEGLRGASRRSRAKVLNLKIFNHGTGLTVAYEHLFLALYFGVILLGYALIPESFQNTLGEDWMGVFWEDSGTAAAVISLLVVYLAQTALQPWFVGAGFGLYINCRTQLEAWDIEVAFRRMIQRRANLSAAAIVLAFLGSFALLQPGSVVAQESDSTGVDETEIADGGFSGYWSEEEIAPALEIILADEALQTEHVTEEWERIVTGDGDPDPESDSGDSSWIGELLDGIGRLLSLIVEFGLWILVAFLLFLIFATRKTWLPYLNLKPGARMDAPRVVLASGEIVAESLPDDIPTEVQRLWNSGEKRKALSLLYRGSVFAAVTQHGVRLPPSATEGACIEAVEQQAGESQSNFFRRIVSAWVRCAYGFSELDDESVMPLCKEWPQHYGDNP